MLGGKQVSMAGTEDFTNRLLLAVQRSANLDLRDSSLHHLLIRAVYISLSLFDKQGDPRMTSECDLKGFLKGLERDIS